MAKEDTLEGKGKNSLAKRVASRYAWNPFLERPARPRPRAGQDHVYRFHRSLEQYRPTPLRNLTELASQLGLGQLLIKDESDRFGLKSFKVLGASYGIHRFLESEGRKSQANRAAGRPGTGTAQEAYTFATATDGNHGRAVAWSARCLGHRAVVYVPFNVSEARIEAIRAEGAQVEVVDGIYDDAVCAAERDSRRNGWQILSDQSYEGYTKIPSWIMDGYTTLFREADTQVRERCWKQPDTLFIQAGVGGLACAAIRFLERMAPFPGIVLVEPLEAAGLLSSIESPGGQLCRASGTINSIMSGLNCATPSRAAWPLLRRRVPVFLALEDRWAIRALQILHDPSGSDPQVVAGESGAAGLAGLLAVCQEPGLRDLRNRLGLNRSSSVLLINTEGDTDPESFLRAVRGE